MNRTAKTILLLTLLTAVGSCSTRGGAGDYLEHENAGTAASLRGDYVEAEKHFKAALAVAEQDGPDSYEVAAALHYLGDNYAAQNKYAEAEAAFLRRLSVAEKLYGERHPDTVPALEDLRGVYIRQRRADEAKNYNERVLAILSTETDEKYKPARDIAELYRKAAAEAKGADPK